MERKEKSCHERGDRRGSDSTKTKRIKKRDRIRVFVRKIKQEAGREVRNPLRLQRALSPGRRSERIKKQKGRTANQGEEKSLSWTKGFTEAKGGDPEERQSVNIPRGISPSEPRASETRDLGKTRLIKRKKKNRRTKKEELKGSLGGGPWAVSPSARSQERRTRIRKRKRSIRGRGPSIAEKGGSWGATAKKGSEGGKGGGRKTREVTEEKNQKKSDEG